MICKKCNQIIPDDASICPHCNEHIAVTKKKKPIFYIALSVVALVVIVIISIVSKTAKKYDKLNEDKASAKIVEKAIERAMESRVARELLSSNEDIYVVLKPGVPAKDGIIIMGLDKKAYEEYADSIDSTTTYEAAYEYTMDGLISMFKDGIPPIKYTKPLDGSNEKIEYWYMLPINKIESYVFTGGANKTAEDLKNDKEDDGVFKLTPPCKEYK